MRSGRPPPRPSFGSSAAIGCASRGSWTWVPVGSWSRAWTRPTTSARHSNGCASRPSDSVGSPSAVAARGSARSATPTSARSTMWSSGRSRSRIRRPSPTPTRSPRCLAPTSCSSGRPTCRTRSACRAGSTTRSTSMPSRRCSRPAIGTARRPGSCSTIGRSSPDTSSSASGSSGSVRTWASWPRVLGAWSRPPKGGSMVGRILTRPRVEPPGLGRRSHLGRSGPGGRRR